MTSELTTPAPRLTTAQREHFIRDGYVAVSGLIPEDVVASTRLALADALGFDFDDPKTWPGATMIVPAHGHELTESCRTEAVEAVAEELVGPHFRRGVCHSPHLENCGQEPLIGGYIPVLNLPRSGPRTFVPHDGWHLDGIHRTRLWPETQFLIVLAYLSDTPDYGGATAVRPGSHRQVLEHWLAQETIPTGSALHPDLPYAAPVPVPGKAGDVIFMHYLLSHSASENHSDHIRVALNTGVEPDPAQPYQRKAGPPQPDWTLLDWTLQTDSKG